MLDQPDGLRNSQAPDAPAGAPSQKDASRTRDWAAGLRGLQRSAPVYVWQAAQFTYENFASFVGKCMTALVVLVVLLIVYQGLTRHVTVVDTISVPKPLVDRGYSQDVAAQRFRDAIAKFVAPLKTDLTTSEVALHAEQPDIVVPTVGISLDAVMSLLRSLLRSTRSQSMGGELTIDDDKLWLRLRLNGVEFYRSKEGVDPQNLDAVFAAAVPEAIRKIAPYLLAQSYYNGKNLDGAFDLAKWITANLPESDENVTHAYNLRGIILTQRKQYAEAEEELHKAVGVNNAFAAPHVNLGNIRRVNNKLPEAIEEYREAIRINPRDALAYNLLGIVLSDTGKQQEAIEQLRAAAAIDPKWAIPHNNIGVALHRMKDDDGAIAEYQRAIDMKADYVLPHENVVVILGPRKDFAGIVTQEKQVIRIDPNNARAHYNLANALGELGQNDDAIKEYREAGRLEPRNTQPLIRLAQLLEKAGKPDDAIAEFQAVLKIEPNNKIALDYLKDHPGKPDKPAATDTPPPTEKPSPDPATKPN
jgi:tetratricopeptide (TPR) repeat protein